MGNRKSGLKAAVTMKLMYGDNYYRRIGAMGGRAGHTGGFWADRELASRAGRIGGKKSRRGKTPLLWKLDDMAFEDWDLAKDIRLTRSDSWLSRIFKRNNNRRNR